MKYFSTIITLIFLNSILVFCLMYYGKKSEFINEQNIKINYEINKYNEQIKINEVEYNFLNKYSNLIKLQEIYLDFEKSNFNKNNRITLNDFKIKDVKNFYQVKSN